MARTPVAGFGTQNQESQTARVEDLGARVTATDPVANQRAREILPLTKLVDDPYACVTGADAVVVVTEWPEYVNLDWNRVARLVRRTIRPFG